MRTTYKYSNLEPSPALEEYTDKKAEGLAARLQGIDPDGEARLYVEFLRDTKHQHGLIFSADAVLHVHGKEIRAAASGEEMYATVDELRDKLSHGIDRYKDTIIAERHGKA